MSSLSLRPRSWFVSAVFAAILFIGNVASNLIANYVQLNLEPYRPWVWLAFAIAMVVTVVVAIRDYRQSDPAPARRNAVTAGGPGAVAIGNDGAGATIITGGIGGDAIFLEQPAWAPRQGTAQGWIDKVIRPSIQRLKAVKRLLTQNKVLTWRFNGCEFDEIPRSRDLVWSAQDTLEHFTERHPDAKSKLTLYDQRRAELSTACQRLHGALIADPRFYSIYEKAKADDSLVNGRAVGGDFESYEEKDHLESLAESIVNRRHEESYGYLYERVWMRYCDDFLALRIAPDIGPESESVDRAAENLLEIVEDLISWMSMIGRRLADEHDASF